MEDRFAKRWPNRSESPPRARAPSAAVSPRDFRVSERVSPARPPAAVHSAPAASAGRAAPRWFPARAGERAGRLPPAGSQWPPEGAGGGPAAGGSPWLPRSQGESQRPGTGPTSAPLRRRPTQPPGGRAGGRAPRRRPPLSSPARPPALPRGPGRRGHWPGARGLRALRPEAAADTRNCPYRAAEGAQRAPSARPCSREGFLEAGLAERGGFRGPEWTPQGGGGAPRREAGERRAGRRGPGPAAQSGRRTPAQGAPRRREPGESWELSEGGDHVVSVQMAPEGGRSWGSSRRGRGWLLAVPALGEPGPGRGLPPTNASPLERAVPGGPSGPRQDGAAERGVARERGLPRRTAGSLRPQPSAGRRELRAGDCGSSRPHPRRDPSPAHTSPGTSHPSRLGLSPGSSLDCWVPCGNHVFSEPQFPLLTWTGQNPCSLRALTV